MKNRFIEVDRGDLSAVTTAILENWIKQYESGGGREYTVCRFCGRGQDYDYESNTIKNPKHTCDCPVLISISIQPH